MEIIPTGNKTITEFVLLGFYDIPELHFLFFIVFTAVYVFIIIGNMLIIVAVVSSQRLHKPMYIFLVNLSFLEILYTSTRVAQVTTLVLSVFCLTIPFGLILTSYGRIVVAVLRVPAGASRRKAFSTCSSHLAVVTTFYGTLMTLYVAPSAVHSQNLSKVFSLLYTVVTPLFNPVIYTLRNKVVHQALRKILCIKQTLD
ncbi:hypothetical protein EGM_13390 [Macaca fascicularis]|uniref:G-protein coupled receptors family 1 profile domain-containing protein n=1 Tax=Macaca fascicularis TaxID=9541 RepID=G7P3V1_MACFA|nr:hypothetical protein EGM_13390 [Macaca fascicularis]